MTDRSSVADRIKHKRAPGPRGGTSAASDRAERLVRHNAFLAALDDTVSWMATAVIGVLSDALDDWDAHEADFRSGFQRCCRRMLTQAAAREERVLFFHEAVPGFTVIVMKKDGWLGADSGIAWSDPTGSSATGSSHGSSKDRGGKGNGAGPDLQPLIDKERDAALNAIINAYVTRTGNRVLTIEGDDVSIALFPVTDLRANLKEMGFWA